MKHDLKKIVVQIYILVPEIASIFEVKLFRIEF